jgi:hypothetical protein
VVAIVVEQRPVIRRAAGHRGLFIVCYVFESSGIAVELGVKYRPVCWIKVLTMLTLQHLASKPSQNNTYLKPSF